MPSQRDYRNRPLSVCIQRHTIRFNFELYNPLQQHVYEELPYPNDRPKSFAFEVCGLRAQPVRRGIYAD